MKSRTLFRMSYLCFAVALLLSGVSLGGCTMLWLMTNGHVTDYKVEKIEP